MTFSINMSGHAGPGFKPLFQDGAWNEEMGVVHAIVQDAINRLRAMGLEVSHVHVNDIEVRPKVP